MDCTDFQCTTSDVPFVDDAEMRRQLAEIFLQMQNGATVETVKHRFINAMLKKCSTSMEDICQLFTTHVPVDGKIRAQFLDRLSQMNKKDWDIVLAQDFVRKDKLQKICQTLCKGGYESMVHALLAVDGLKGSKWNQNPNYDLKRYFENLRINLCGNKSMYDNGPRSIKLPHVLGVRGVYELLYKKYRNDSIPMHKRVYEVMRTVLNNMNPELKLKGEEEVMMTNDELEDCVSEYKKCMDEDMIRRYMYEVYHIDMTSKNKKNESGSVNSEPETNSDNTDEEEMEEGADPEPSPKRKREEAAN